MAPAEPKQIIGDRFGQHAEFVAIGIDPQRAVALAQLGAVRAVDQRHMGVSRLRPAHRIDDRQLPESIVQMVVAANDVGDPHVVIVDHHREHVGRRAVGAQQDEIVELGILDRDFALDLVLDHRLAFARGLDANDGRLIGGPVVAVAPRAVDPERLAFGLGLFALRGQFLLASSSSDRRGRWRASGARLRRGGPRIATDNIRGRPNRGRASACRRGSRRSPPWSSAPCRYPRCAAGTCRRDGGRTAS